MAVFVDLEMSTETALKLLAFIRQQDGSESDLNKLFGEIERQVLDSIEYEARYAEGKLHKKPTNWAVNLSAIKKAEMPNFIKEHDIQVGKEPHSLLSEL